jgi:hypothetical protein
LIGVLDDETLGAKALEIVPVYGTAEAVPFPNRRELGLKRDCPKPFELELFELEPNSELPSGLIWVGHDSIVAQIDLGRARLYSWHKFDLGRVRL